MEDSMLRDQIERYNQRLRDFEEKQRAYRGQQERSAEQELEVRPLRKWRSSRHLSNHCHNGCANCSLERNVLRTNEPCWVCAHKQRRTNKHSSLLMRAHWRMFCTVFVEMCPAISFRGNQNCVWSILKVMQEGSSTERPFSLCTSWNCFHFHVIETNWWSPVLPHTG